MSTEAVTREAPRTAHAAVAASSEPTIGSATQGKVKRTPRLLWIIVARELRLMWLLFGKEVRELLVSRALWAMALFSSLLVGFTFIQAVGLYSDASATAVKLPQLAVNQNPLDGIVIRVFAAVYLLNTFLLPFVAIRAIGNEKQTSTLKLALQLPVGIYRTVAIKLGALFVGWLITLIPAASALVIWSLLLGGHLYGPELLGVLLGHASYALVIAGVAFLAASITESAATAAIVTLAFTLASWILDFAGSSATSGFIRGLASFSLTPALRGLEQGLVGSPTAVALFVLAFAFFALTVVWLPPGVSRTTKLVRSGAVVGVSFQALLLAIQLPLYFDLTEDRRNSFNPADVRALQQMPKELKVNVNLATNDNRFVELQRNVLTKLQRTAPHVTITYAETSTSSLLGGTSGANYGVNTYTYGGKQGSSRATSAREVLSLIETLGGQTVASDPLPPYPGYPLVTSADGASIWFYGALPVLAIVGWWYFQRAPEIPGWVRAERVHTRSRWPWLDPYTPGLRRAALAAGVALVAVQFVPYGRDHTNIVVSGTSAVVTDQQWCPTTFADSSKSTMTLGAFRQQITSMQANLDAALNGLAARNGGAIRDQYAQLATTYPGVAKEIAELYPVRCPRLLTDRIAGDAAILGAQIDGAGAGTAMTALRAGLAAVGGDLDQRMRQASPNGFVGNQDQTTSDAPTITGVPTWDSDRTQQLATRACAACHSNTPGWPWYANLAPLSWVVQHDVDSGRAAMNLSEWDLPQAHAMSAADSVQNGRMPPAWAGLFDSRLRLSDSERAELVRGLMATMNTVPTR
jgi:ABC-2 type transport system permease protein